MRKLFFCLICFFSASIVAAPTVLFETSMGNFTVELDSENAPQTTENFLQYVNDGSYNGTIFHRVIPNFMAQGGGFDSDMNRVKTHPPIRNEADNGLKNKTATIAMARTQDPHSATRQFFINYSDNHFLDYSASNAGYAVFGKVTQGFDVVVGMSKQETVAMAEHRDVPFPLIVINNTSVINNVSIQK